jgi:hypothetical protein
MFQLYDKCNGGPSICCLAARPAIWSGTDHAIIIDVEKATIVRQAERSSSVDWSDLRMYGPPAFAAGGCERVGA